MVAPEGAVYCTLLLSDNYLPGAVVLAHSLRDNGTQAKLVALYTPDTLQPATINELKTVYDELIPVYRMTNHTPANLWLMERPDLIATFTKIELWKQIQYKRIVYIDCDVVSIRAPDELLELDVDFAAAPDVGWPDIFNSGVMVLRPNLQDYYALRALAERGISFDGADQGLLNIHFRDWHRLSFTYNCTPSANYQYIPAYKHFQSTISLIHFIGSQKPWNMPRQVAPFDSPFNQLLGRWWTIYDRHYRSVAIEEIQPTSHETTQTIPSIVGPVPDTVHPQPQTERSGQQYSEHIEHAPSGPASEPYHHHHHDHHRQPRSEFSNSQPEYHAPAESSHETAHMSYPPESSNASLPSEHVHHAHAEHHSWQPVQEPIYSVVPQYVRGEEHVRAYLQQQPLQDHIRHHTQPPQEHIHHQIQPPHEHQPSVSSEPRPSQHHDPHPAQSHAPAEMQREPSPQPPPEEQIFEAPKSEWDASREPPPLDSKPEGYALETKTYTMSEDKQLFQPPDSYPEAPKNMWYEVPATKPQPQKIAQIFPWETSAPKPTRVFAHKERQVEPASSPIPSREEPRESQSPQPTSWTSEIASLPSESFDTYSRSNAWDEVPEIQKYIQSIQQARKARVQVLSGDFTNQSTTYPFSTLPGNFSGRGTRVTDFPTEFERPSLPVTPAPIHRGPALGSPDDYTTAQLPAAEGVPSQEDWNPSLRLEELRRRRTGVLGERELESELDWAPDACSLVERLEGVLGDDGSRHGKANWQ